MKDKLSPEQKYALVAQLVMALNDAIKEATEKSSLKGIPNGELYAIVENTIPFDVYMAIIQAGKKAGRIKESNNVLTWVEK